MTLTEQVEFALNEAARMRIKSRDAAAWVPALAQWLKKNADTALRWASDSICPLMRDRQRTKGEK